VLSSNMIHCVATVTAKVSSGLCGWREQCEPAAAKNPAADVGVYKAIHERMHSPPDYDTALYDDRFPD
jgi:hypothetical protein